MLPILSKKAKNLSLLQLLACLDYFLLTILTLALLSAILLVSGIALSDSAFRLSLKHT